MRVNGNTEMEKKNKFKTGEIMTKNEEIFLTTDTRILYDIYIIGTFHVRKFGNMKKK